MLELADKPTQPSRVAHVASIQKESSFHLGVWSCLMWSFRGMNVPTISGCSTSAISSSITTLTQTCNFTACLTSTTLVPGLLILELLVIWLEWRYSIHLTFSIITTSCNISIWFYILNRSCRHYSATQFLSLSSVLYVPKYLSFMSQNFHSIVIS